ncbi:DUF6766 family protein [Saccharothrix variisporea]|uniref:Uncharacterized protein n=1 Tax=Saccharothrix variisporea TaxID=543527 RepID=A0A495X444_9PSEU|nr:DUF6766 family protein [Saccharothrix variisporea]RKT68782.1 hypothetical protein DFJ66_1975 [Saccharothrix variisporea]
MKRFLRDNGLALVFGLLFLGSLVGQAFAGNAALNDRRLVDGGDPIGLWQYITSSDFAVDVAENWQSEYLQFFLFIFATVWLMQRGSNESKPSKRLGPESDEQQYLGEHAKPNSPPWARAGGWRTRLYSNSLGLIMLLLFIGSWLAQSIAGRSAYNNEQLVDFQDPVSWWDYVLSADFWNRSLQNWQSEFLAIGSMAIFSVYLRQRGSSESKPVGAPHDTTDESG